MSDEFNQRAAQLALSDIERDLIQASRDFEDATRSQDEYLAADAMKRYAEHKKNYDELAGTGQQQQPSGQLSTAQVNFLSRRQAGGDHLDGKRMQDYARGHDRAVAAGLEPNSPQYFNAATTAGAKSRRTLPRRLEFNRKGIHHVSLSKTFRCVPSNLRQRPSQQPSGA